jgi:hypothetical protein
LHAPQAAVGLRTDLLVFPLAVQTKAFQAFGRAVEQVIFRRSKAVLVEPALDGAIDVGCAGRQDFDDDVGRRPAFFPGGVIVARGARLDAPDEEEIGAAKVFVEDLALAEVEEHVTADEEVVAGAEVIGDRFDEDVHGVPVPHALQGNFILGTKVGRRVGDARVVRGRRGRDLFRFDDVSRHGRNSNGLDSAQNNSSIDRTPSSTNETIPGIEPCGSTPKPR